jgi:hypothetical protein
MRTGYRAAAEGGSPDDAGRYFRYKTAVETAQPKSCSTCGNWWRLPLLLAAVLIVAWLMRGRGIWNAVPVADKSAAQKAVATTNERVLLAIDFPKGRQDFDPLPWYEGMTAADQLRSAPGVKVTQSGSDAAALLTAINDVANEGADGSNWTYQVNDESAERSVEVCQLKPGDRVLWTYGKRR